jgi:alpha-galactosidase
LIVDVLDAGLAGDEPMVWRHGYQSWSPSGWARLGVDTDPSARKAPSLVRSMHHADPTPVDDPLTLRSEQVVIVRGADGAPQVYGFDAGTEHDGTFRVRVHRGRIELAVDAVVGDATGVPLHRVERYDSLDAWAAGQPGRVDAPYQVGWCSWYHWFHSISEDALRAQLELAADWPFEVFQLDDGFQAHIGDWLETNDRFTSSMPGIASSIADAGRTPGIWLAPFLVSLSSRVAREHPDWLVQHEPTGRPLLGGYNDEWGGLVGVLDTTRPEVLDHIAGIARALVDMGFPYLKLDFTYAPSIPGAYADPGRTPAQRVRAGIEAVRRGAGEGAFLLGCGMPLAQGVGLVDGMRIGPDVVPHWEPKAQPWEGPSYIDVAPSTASALRATVARQFMHRRLWLNDPDCLMLRTTETELTPEQVQTWARAVGGSGGMALVSDDLSLLGVDARALLDEVIAAGRAADAAAAITARS